MSCASRLSWSPSGLPSSKMMPKSRSSALFPSPSSPMPKQAEGRKEGRKEGSLRDNSVRVRSFLCWKSFNFRRSRFFFFFFPTSDDFLAPLSLSLSHKHAFFLHTRHFKYTLARADRSRAERGEGGRAVSSHVYVV